MKGGRNFMPDVTILAFTFANQLRPMTTALATLFIMETLKV